MLEAGARLRPVVAALSGALALLAAALPGCGTEAQAVDPCRQIEETRCREAVHCPNDFAVHTEEEVQRCVSFYRDQCLHGMQVPDPGAPKVSACVNALTAAGTCAAQNKPTLASKSSTDATTCNIVPVDGVTTATTACGVLLAPESVAQCSFLAPPPEDAGASPAPDATDDGSGGDAPAE
jgi:hypothetical protein